MMTPIDSYTTMHVTKNKTSSACASGKQKEHDKSHFSSCIFYMCWKKVEAAKEEGIRALGKQFYVLAPCLSGFG